MFNAKLVGIVNHFRRKFNCVSTKPKVAHAFYNGTDILVLKNEVVGQLILAGNYENGDIHHLLSTLKDGDTFFDVGANMGLFGLVAAKHNPSLNIHVFEPIPINVALIRLSVLLNGIDNIVINQACVGDYDGEIEFSIGADSAFSSIIATGRVSERDRIKSKIICLDSYLSENSVDHVDVLKVDVEGAEKLVLLGADEMLSKRQPKLIMMELYNPNFVLFKTSIFEIVSIMRDKYKYSPYVIVGGNKVAYEQKHHDKIYNVFFERSI